MSVIKGPAAEQLPVNPVVTAQIDPVLFKQQVNLKVANAFQKLIAKLTEQNKTLFQVFDAYNLTKKNMMNIGDYDRIMIILDPTFTMQEIELAFSLFDKNSTKNVSLKDFIEYFTAVTGQIPTQGYLIRKDSNNSDTSLTIPIQSPTHTYPQMMNGNQPYYAYQQQGQQQIKQMGYPQQPTAQLNVQQPNIPQPMVPQPNAQYMYNNGYGYSADVYNQYRYTDRY